MFTVTNAWAETAFKRSGLKGGRLGKLEKLRQTWVKLGHTVSGKFNRLRCDTKHAFKPDADVGFVGLGQTENVKI
jgi:hypothetical protein